MNIDGIYNESDFKKGDIAVIRSEYDFPSEIGIHTVEGKLFVVIGVEKGI